MNKYLKMLIFVSILGIISGGLLFGAKAITGDLITANADALLKSEILTAHGISFNFTNIHDVFTEETNTITEEGEYDDEPFTYTFYQDKTSGAITFGFGPTFGGGHDIHICNNANTIMNSYSHLGNSYQHPQPNQGYSYLAGSYNFQLSEIEVYEKL